MTAWTVLQTGYLRPTSAFENTLAVALEKFTTQGMSVKLVLPTPDPKLESSSAQLMFAM